MDETCPGEYATERVWHGTNEYDFYEEGGRRRRFTGRRGKSHRYEYRSGPRVVVAAREARTSNRFADNTLICVTRSEEPFIDMSEAECPNGKIRCNSKSITTCYSPGEEDTCPITDVKLVKKEGFSLTNYPGYVLATAPEALQWYLLYSRTSEHLPVSGF